MCQENTQPTENLLNAAILPPKASSVSKSRNGCFTLGPQYTVFILLYSTKLTLDDTEYTAQILETCLSVTVNRHPPWDQYASISAD